jgi:hypothetical protein
VPYSDGERHSELPEQLLAIGRKAPRIVNHDSRPHLVGGRVDRASERLLESRRQASGAGGIQSRRNHGERSILEAA